MVSRHRNDYAVTEVAQKQLQNWQIMGSWEIIAIKGRMFAEREDVNNNTTTYFLHCNF